MVAFQPLLLEALSPSFASKRIVEPASVTPSAGFELQLVAVLRDLHYSLNSFGGVGIEALQSALSQSESQAFCQGPGPRKGRPHSQQDTPLSHFSQALQTSAQQQAS